MAAWRFLPADCWTATVSIEYWANREEAVFRLPQNTGATQNTASGITRSLFWAGGFVSDIYGLGTTKIRLTPGRTSRELFAGSNIGLRNFMGSEIHVVLRSHGPAGVAGTVAQQVGTANEACPIEECKNVFASIHKGRSN